MKAQPFHIVRTSKIHGRGVFAKRPIRKGTQVIEYTGPIISAKEADKVGEQFDNGHSHTMLFSIDENRVINGNSGGDARYINHGCDPNCEAVQDGDKIFIESLRAIKQGEEITYDYHLQVEGKITGKVRKEYACFCGSPKCRGTQIATEILEAQDKKDAKKAAKKAAKKEKKRREKEMKKALKAQKAQEKAQKKAKTKAKAEVKDLKVEKKKKDLKSKDKSKQKSKPANDKAISNGTTAGAAKPKAANKEKKRNKKKAK